MTTNLTLTTIVLLSLILLHSCNAQKTRSGSNIDCIGYELCFDGYSINCKDYTDCIVTCYGDSACQRSIINCPINAHCTVYCGDGTEEDECHDIIIYAQQSKLLTMSCGDGAETCDGMEIYCPLYAFLSSPGCIISGINNLNLDHDAQIYAVQGLNDVLISGDSPDDLEIFCKEDYSQTCIIDPDTLNVCSSGNTICETYTTTSHPTTANPTTANPTTSNPTTANPTTANPTTSKPTTMPTTAKPTTSNPTTANPTTSKLTTSRPTTSSPTTSTSKATAISAYELNVDITTKTPLNENGVTQSTHTTNSGDFTVSKSSSNVFADDLYILIILILGLVICCALVLFCIFLAYNRRRKLELKLTKQQLQTVEMNRVNSHDSVQSNDIAIDLTKVDSMNNGEAHIEIEGETKLPSPPQRQNIQKVNSVSMVDENIDIMNRDKAESIDAMYNVVTTPITPSYVINDENEQSSDDDEDNEGNIMYKETLTTKTPDS